MRWRVNSEEFAWPFSKKGLFRGYLKYGIITYFSWYYVTQKMFAPSHHGGHGGHHGDGHH